MRKLFLLLFVSMFLLIFINNDFTSAEAVNMNDFNVTYTSEVYEPTEPSSVTTVTGSIHINKGVTKFNAKIRYELFSPLKSGMSKAYASGNLFTFTYPFQIHFDYNFTIDDRSLNLAREGITVRIGIYDNDTRSFINYIDGHLYNKKEESVNINEVSGDLIYDKCLYLSDNKATETFNFDNYSSILEIEHYYRLDISSLSFRYNFIKPFKMKEAYLMFVDEYNLFPYLNEEDGKKKVALKAIEKNKVVTLGYETLYVEPDSLSMSSTKKSGYIETNYLYLPKNQLSKLQGMSLFIFAKELGVSSLSFVFSCSMNISHLLLGPCNLAEYCVVGGVES